MLKGIFAFQEVKIELRSHIPFMTPLLVGLKSVPPDNILLLMDIKYIMSNLLKNGIMLVLLQEH